MFRPSVAAEPVSPKPAKPVVSTPKPVDTTERVAKLRVDTTKVSVNTGSSKRDRHKGEAVLVRLSPDEMAKLDRYRDEGKLVVSRSEALRTMVRLLP